MSQANKDLMRRWFDEVWNKGNESTIDELFAAGAVGHGLAEGEQPIHGPDEFKIFARNIRGSFPDVRISIEDLMTRLRLSGTHKGDGLGVPPTGKPVSIAGIVLVRIANGQIVEGWNSWDQLSLLTQIGALPTAERRDRFIEELG